MQVTWVWSLVRKVSWSRKWQPTPVFLPGKFHGRRSLAGYNPWGPRVRHKWATEHVLFTIIWSSDLNFIVKYTDIVQFSHSVVSNSFRPCGLQHARFPVHHQLRELIQAHVHQVGDAIQSSHPLLSPSPPAFKLSQYQSLFQWVSSLHQVAKLLEFQFQHQSFQWIFRTVSFRMYWLDVLSVQGTLKSLLQHHSSKASILWRSAFFIVQLSHPYMTSGKTIALTRWTFVGKVISLLVV